MEYAKRFCTSRNKDALQKMRECVHDKMPLLCIIVLRQCHCSWLPCLFRLLAQQGFTEQELGLMTNLQPMTPDEVFKLIPSLDVRLVCRRWESQILESCQGLDCVAFGEMY